MGKCLLCCDICGLGRVFADIVDDRSGCRKSLRVIVETETSELSDAKLLPEYSHRVVGLKRPIFNAAFNPARPIEKRSLRGFKELLRPWQQRLAWMQKLQFLPERLLGTRAAKFSSLKFSSGKVYESESDG